MTTEKKLYLCEQYAHKLWALGMGLGQEAARAGSFGRGYAVVAHETRILADNLFEYVTKARFEGENPELFNEVTGLALEMFYLSINTELEVTHVCDTGNEMATNKAVVVSAGMLRSIAIALIELGDSSFLQGKSSVLAEITAPLTSTHKSDNYLRFSIGGVPFVECISNVIEIISYRGFCTDGGDFIAPRGMKLPVLNCYKKFGLTRKASETDFQPTIIVHPDFSKFIEGNYDNMYAVMVDEMDDGAIISSQIGTPVTAQGGHALMKFTRECWDAVGGGQFQFLDWGRLIAE